MSCGSLPSRANGWLLVKYACWHVLGAGAIGCLFASALQRGGQPYDRAAAHGAATGHHCGSGA